MKGLPSLLPIPLLQFFCKVKGKELGLGLSPAAAILEWYFPPPPQNSRGTWRLRLGPSGWGSCPMVKSTTRHVIRGGHSLASKAAFHLPCPCQSYNIFHSYFSRNFEMNLICPASPEIVHGWCYCRVLLSAILIPPAGLSLCTHKKPDQNSPPVFRTASFIWARKPVLPHSTFLLWFFEQYFLWTVFPLHSSAKNRIWV